jgi:molecular chaperone GrpE
MSSKNKNAESKPPIKINPQKNIKKSENISQDITNSQEFIKLKIENTTLQKELEDWKNKTMRYAAEVQNLQKQHDLDVSSSKKKTKKFVVEAILPFLNTINLAFGFLPKTEDDSINKFVSALDSSFKKLKQDLELISIELIEPKVGDEVDPAIMNVLNPNPEITNPKVAGIVSMGLKIDGDLLQAANIMIQ